MQISYNYICIYINIYLTIWLEISDNFVLLFLISQLTEITKNSVIQYF